MENKILIITNAFSLGMLPAGLFNLRIQAIAPQKAREVVAESCYKSIIGHADTAKLFSKELDAEFPMNRETFVFSDETLESCALLVGQYVGARLPEGTTELPKGASIRWWIVFAHDTWRIDL